MVDMFSTHRAASRCSLTAVTVASAFLGYNSLISQSKNVTKTEGGKEWQRWWGGQQQNNDTDATVGNQVLARQLWHPKLPYPLWDYNWDGKMTEKSTLEAISKVGSKPVLGTTRHIILIRHGQYEETSKNDEQRRLTPLGREQAKLTGKRLAEMAKGINGKLGPCGFKIIRSSNMLRARETADIIATYLEGVKVAAPDELLNEALPAAIIPSRPDIEGAEQEIDENHERIESAFQKYMYRGPEGVEPKHEFEIIVCHGNVIRYFFARALQIPPEAWLRMSTFNCSLTYLMIKPNGYCSARMMGDIGHLGLANTTFSGFPGFAWS